MVFKFLVRFFLYSYKQTNMAIENLLGDLEALKRINNEINRQDVILWFNENDIDYFNMTDIEMYIHYIKNAENLD